jgi:predicted Zn-dependent protease with MMP-like domain
VPASRLGCRARIATHIAAMTQGLFHDPDEATITRLARAALAALPAEFQPNLADIVIRVQEFADPEQLAAVNLTDPRQLVGLYRGHPVSKQSIWASGDLPPTVFLFRQPLLARWRQTGATLEAVVNHLVVHEVGHHFGLSDDEMHGLEGEA